MSETASWIFSDWKLKGHADMGERDHLHRSFLVGRVALIYLALEL